MFRVVIDSTIDFKRLLGTTVNSSLTFRIQNKQLTLLVASTEVIVLYKVATPVETEDCSFSVFREQFSRVYNSGNFNVDINGSAVTMYFYDANNQITHTAEFPYIQDIESLYIDMLNMINSNSGYEVAVKELLPIARLAINRQTSLQVSNGVASAIINSNMKVFKAVNTNVDFNIRFAHLRLLISNPAVWYKVQQYLYTKCGSLLYVCATDRLNNCDGEYQMVHGGYNIAVKMRMFMKLKPFRDLAASHFKFSSMKLNLDSRCLLLDGDVKCKIFLEVSDLKKTSDFKDTELVLPKELLNILGVFGDTVMLTHRKSFLCLSDNNGVEVYFN